MDSWKEMDKIAFEISCLEIMYDGLSEETKAITTFPQYAAYRNPHWSKWDILQGIIIAGEKKKEVARWMEEQRNPTPSRSTQPCYSCKGPWEPDHRCRGKDPKHTIEAHYDSEDESCEDGSIDAYLEQFDDDSDSCTEQCSTGTRPPRPRDGETPGGMFPHVPFLGRREGTWGDATPQSGG
jgi:hypothetical protein